jgi:hypothetical protein
MDSPGVPMPFSVHHDVEQDDAQRPHHQNSNDSDALDFLPARQKSPMFGTSTKPLISQTPSNMQVRKSVKSVQISQNHSNSMKNQDEKFLTLTFETKNSQEDIVPLNKIDQPKTVRAIKSSKKSSKMSIQSLRHLDVYTNEPPQMTDPKPYSLAQDGVSAAN